MQRASVLVVPSICFESFPIVVAEAFACGTPVIASHLGALGEIVEDGVTGALVPPGDPVALHVKLASFLSDPGLPVRLGDSARLVYQERYTPEVNLRRIYDIYASAIKHFHSQ